MFETKESGSHVILLFVFQLIYFEAIGPSSMRAEGSLHREGLNDKPWHFESSDFELQFREF